MPKTTMATRYEIIQGNADKYRRATKKKKGEILDVVCGSTGMSRNRASRLMAKGGYQQTKLRSAKPIRAETRGRKPKYGAGELKALIILWKYGDYICGKKLVAAIPGLMDALIRFGEVDWDEELQQSVREMSASTIDRLLVREKKKNGFKGLSTTKPGTLLKRDIPVRMGTEWDDAKPGFLEIDLVAHCGDTTVGDYVNTLDATDVVTGWTEVRAAVNKAQIHVISALMDIEGFLPFPMRGVDSDNGAEFINDHLMRFCKTRELKFTRSRPYRKNDGCHVEQKNWSVVRKHMGYERYEGQETVDLMNAYYELLGLYLNYFVPQTKLLSKERIDSHVKKKYDEYRTPYERVLASPDVSPENKDYLREVYATLNPADLLRKMALLQKKLQVVALPYSGKRGS